MPRIRAAQLNPKQKEQYFISLYVRGGATGGDSLRGATSTLTHEYVRREVYGSPNLSNPYGMRTNWGEKVYLKLDPGSYIVIN